MPDQPRQDSGDWADFYQHTAGREARPLFAKGMAALNRAGMTPGQAVEIGFGDGTETLALLAAGWQVFAIDSAPAAAERLRSQVPASVPSRLTVQSAAAESVPLPPFDLLYAGYALPFLRPDSFPGFWTGVRSQLRPGGFIVVNFFGPHDSWFGREEMSFIDLDDVKQLADGLELIAIDEEDKDGDSFLGPKHWHVFDLIARQPPGGVHA
jgi:SAM-dependent methyltransferase